ncbi:MAG: zinc-binding alcohol dehydrogenase family protein [Caldilineae bacterium]|nr:MAG: zinc-binding alcohol dehydrogenase family protein [Caldilineae bacterium]
MRAYAFTAPGSVEPVDIAEPQVGPEDVLVEVHYLGLCGSDLRAYRGEMPLVTYPRIPGHEIGGLIIARGEEVPAGVAVGARVMVSPYTACGLCTACRAGRPNCCRYNETLGVQRDGALTLRVAVPYTAVFSSDILSPQELALVEPLSVGYHAANRGRVCEVDRVLVLGCGAVGLGAIAAAARKGATVIALDIDDTKLDLARQLGAEYTINSAQEDPLAVIADLTHGEGVEVAIEAIGLPDTYRLAVEAAAFAGRVVYVGYARRQVAYDTTHFVKKELDILGSRNALRVFPAVINMLERRERPFDSLVSRVYPFAQAPQAFRDWAADPAAITKILIDVQAS